MQLTYDSTHDVVYVYLSDEIVVRTEEIDSGTLVDVDEHGHPVGIEVIRPARDWPLDEILERFRINLDDVPGLRMLNPQDGARYPFVEPLSVAS